MLWPKKMLLLFLLLVLPAACTPTQQPAPAVQVTSSAVTAIDTSTTDLDLVTGQVVFVPAYSDIYITAEGRTMSLAITLSVNNTDLEHPIVVTSIRYYNTEGTLLREYLEQPVQLAPLASSHVVIDSDDDTGGVGANFIVEWGAEVLVHEPVIEAVMVNTDGQQGLSLISPGRVLSQTGE
jgi:hypothetical protein